MYFSNVNELHEFLSDNDLLGLDSEYSYRSRKIVERFHAKGFDVNRWWVMTSYDWTCPSCNRNKEDLVRLNRHNYLIGHLHEHHDHMSDYVEKKFIEISESLDEVVADIMAEKFIKRTAFALSAYDHTIICLDCNMADGEAKKILGLPEEFSFSPNEISEFIIKSPNQMHQIDKEKAMMTWLKCKPMFHARQKIVLEIATLAATNSHWYQPSIRTAKQVERIAKYNMARYGIDRMNFDPVERALYSTNKFISNSDSWRKNRVLKKQTAPTPGQLAHLAALKGYSWNKVDDSWSCDGCGRSKFQCTRKSNKGEWIFNYYNSKAMFNHGYEPTRHSICMDCCDTLKCIGIEIKREIDDTERTFKCYILSIHELRSIIHTSPHNKHIIDNKILDELLPELLSRTDIV